MKSEMQDCDTPFSESPTEKASSCTESCCLLACRVNFEVFLW